MSVHDSSSLYFEDAKTSPDNDLKKENLNVDKYFCTADMRPRAQGNGPSLKSMIFNSDEDKEKYAREYFAVQRIQNRYIKYK